MSIYRTSAGQAEILSLYDRAEARIARPFEHLQVPTRFGQTHVLVTGPAEAPPLVIFQGGNVVNPLTLHWFRPLLSTFRVYAPDTIGHPGRSAETRISPRDDSYAHWAIDLFDGLGLECPAVLGHSYGGGIILLTAAVAPERIAKAVLLMPCSVALGPILRMLTDVLLPTLQYQFRPSPGPLQRLVERMSDSVAVDELIRETVGAVFRHVKLEHGFPRAATRAELARFTAPVLAFAGRRDVFFPADRVLPRLRERLPNLVAAEALESGHFLLPETLAVILPKIDAFLQQG